MGKRPNRYANLPRREQKKWKWKQEESSGREIAISIAIWPLKMGNINRRTRIAKGKLVRGSHLLD